MVENSLEQPSVAANSTPPQPATVASGEIEIVTIPEKYYGAALKTQIVEEKKPAPAPLGAGEPRRKMWPIFLVAGILLLAVVGGFVYYNRVLLFAPAAPQTPVLEAPPPAPLPTPPSTPAGVIATSTNPQSVLVSWADTSADESGFRVERKNGTGDFIALTSLPPNSTSFLDVSAQPKTAYTYRVKAVNSSGDSAVSNEASATTADVPPPAPEQPKLPPAGLDSDSDGLTDLEESLYGTEARNPDADNDGFLDGNEVFHLYNPAGKAPARLLDLALIKAIDAPIGWVMSIPVSWSSVFTTNDGKSATIDSRHGETFTVTVEDNQNRKPVIDWYLESHPGVTAAQVLQYRAKGGYTGIIGVDQLSTYIPWDNKVFVFTYYLNGQSFINYRTTYSMILNSLMLSGLPQETSATSTAPLPFEPSATTSGVIAQPVPVEQATISQP